MDPKLELEFNYGSELLEYIQELFRKGPDAAKSLDLGEAQGSILFQNLVTDLRNAYNVLLLRDMCFQGGIVKAIAQNLLNEDALYDVIDSFEYFLPKDPSSGYYESDENKERLSILTSLISVFQYAGLMGGRWQPNKSDGDKLRDI